MPASTSTDVVEETLTSLEDDAGARGIAAVDPCLLQAVDREVRGRRERPSEVGEALDHISKQFQLWDVERRTLDDEPARLEPAGFPRATGEVTAFVAQGFERVLAESTKAITRFVSASTLAQRGFTGFRALKRLVLKKPYRPADPA